MSHPFRFGVINEQVFAYSEWLEHVRAVEAYGYDTFLIRDHVVPDYFGDQLAPLVALAAAAQHTTRLRLGTLVLSNDYRHPAMLAKEAATLDILSQGRFELGLGAGWLQTEYDQMGMEYALPGQRIERLAESITVLKGLLGDGAFSYRGAHYQIDKLDGFPKPAQRPKLPLLIGGGHQRMLRLAGREANSVGILTTSVATGKVQDDPIKRQAEHVATQVGWVREGAGERFSQIELSLVLGLRITDQRLNATEELIRARGWSGIRPEQVWNMPSTQIGSVEQICEELQRWREQLGFSYFVISDKDMHAFAPVVERLGGK